VNKKINSYFELYTCILSSEHLYISGRLLKNAPPISKIFTGYIGALINSLRRALTNELAHQPIEIKTSFKTFQSETDEEGYFQVLEEVNGELGKDLGVKFSLAGQSETYVKEIGFTNYRHQAPVGIISDIDDTLLVTNVKSFFKIRLLFNSLFLNPFRRIPIANAAEYYRQKLVYSEGNGPMIYISNSPWNIFSYLKTFLEYNDFPKGELFLRDFGLHMLKKKKPLNFQNKYLIIETILTLFPHTKFILVGDTAEKDFDIYSKIDSAYKEKIDSIIIIKANNKANEKRIENILSEESRTHIKMVNSYSELLDNNLV